MLTYQFLDTTIFVQVRAATSRRLRFRFWNQTQDASNTSGPSFESPGILANFDLGKIVQAIGASYDAENLPEWWDQIRDYVDEDWVLQETELPCS